MIIHAHLYVDSDRADHLFVITCDPARGIDRMKRMDRLNLPTFRHVTSFVSFVFVTANLLLWLPFLLLAAIVRLVVPIEGVQRATYQMVEAIYRMAVKVDAWWFAKVLGIRLKIDDPLNILTSLTPSQSPVVICNHQSWFDIFLLQTLISSRGPILKFVIKVELLWVPVLGWICLALNFPRLRRKADAESRARDRNRVRSASLTLGAEPGGLLIFPEGTRFSEEKRTLCATPYRHLLSPKPGGLSVIQQAMPLDTDVVDISIGYRGGDVDCWRCMSGLVDEIHVKVAATPIHEIVDPAAWLNERWSIKDQWLTHQR